MFWIYLGLLLLQITSIVSQTAVSHHSISCSSDKCDNKTMRCLPQADGTHACHCYQGYRGANCDEDIDECLSGNPCTHRGYCINSIGSYMCDCLDGWSGKHCNHREPSVPVALCVPGWKGENCRDEVDECINLSASLCANNANCNPCQNGATCSNTIGSYDCACVLPWIGKNCDGLPCDSTPCKNGGSCSNIGTGSFPYTCSCDFPWGGHDCETNTACNSSPCHNGGNCTNTKNGTHTCTCKEPWGGSQCQRNTACDINPCLHTGTCSVVHDTFSCSCLSTWSGKRCETNIACDNSPCQNGGTCSLTGDSYICSCPIPWGGQNCGINTTCSFNPCNNNGTCSNETGTYTCTCMLPWRGRTCDMYTRSSKVGAAKYGQAESDDIPLIAVATTVGSLLLLSIVAGSVSAWKTVKKSPKVLPNKQAVAVEAAKMEKSEELRTGWTPDSFF